MAFVGTFVYGDTDKGLQYTVKSRTSGATVDLTGATGPLFFAREIGKKVPAVAAGSTATTGGVAGTISIVPGAVAGLAPGDRKRSRYEVWFEYDLGGTHRIVPDDGPDTIELVDLR